MILRSWFFAPGDGERRLDRGRYDPADALILDIEDSVSVERQQVARDRVRERLPSWPDRSTQQLRVRVNPLDSPLPLPDLAAVMPGAPGGICLPQARNVVALAEQITRES